MVVSGFFYSLMHIKFLTAIIVLMFIPAAVWAGSEQAHDIRGMVVGDDGAPVMGAIVRISGTEVHVMTGIDGRFAVETVPAGEHHLTVEVPYSAYTTSSRRIVVPVGPDEIVTVRLRSRSYDVDEIIVVTPGPTDVSAIEDRPAQVDVVERAEFDSRAVSVADVIAATPSTTISSSGGLGSFSEVSIRGSYANQVQVYLDGMLLNEAIGGTVNLGTIPLANVERVEVWRSGAPARIGGNALGGAINIVTRDTSGGARSVAFGHGAFNTLTAHGIAGFGPARSRLLVTVDYASSDNDFEYTSDNGTPQNPGDDYDGRRINDAFRTMNALVKYRALLGDDLLLELSEHALRSEKEIPGAQHIQYSEASLATTRNLMQSRLSWFPSRAKWLEIAPTVHYIHSREHYEDPGSHVGWGAQDNRYRTDTVRGMMPVTITSPAWGSVTLTPAAGHESSDPEYRLGNTVPLAGDREHLGITGDVAAHTPDSRFMLTAHIRRDRYFSSYSGHTNQFVPEPPPAQFHHFTLSRTGLRFRAHRFIDFRGNYGDIHRVPSFYELFGDRGGVVSNPNLKPERVFSWDAGVRLRMPELPMIRHVRLDIVHFENTYRDLIQWYMNNYGFVQPANVAGAYVRGMEYVWNARLFGSVSVTGNWTHQRSKVTDTVMVYHEGKRLPSRPERYATCTLEYGHGPVTMHWTVDHKEAYYLDRANQDHMKYPGRTLHDAGVSVLMRNDTVTVRLLARNITDRRTFDVVGMPKPGRSYLITLEYHILGD